MRSSSRPLGLRHLTALKKGMRAESDPDLKVYGIFGFPLSHTLSPVIQNCAFDHYGLKSFYFAFERGPREFRFLMRHLKTFLLDGFNVTVPYKGDILKYLDGLTSTAEAIGAVNTVFRKGRRWLGDNTDCYGFLTSLRKEGRFNPQEKRILLLGAGGSARAVAYGLAERGAKEIRIINRQRFQERRKKIVHDFKRTFPATLFTDFSLKEENLAQALRDVELIINATSVGVLYESRRLIPPRLIPKARRGRRLLFFDLAYHKQTPFLDDAERKGHRIQNGEMMLLYQGARAFEIWTGLRAPVYKMRTALRDALRNS